MSKKLGFAVAKLTTPLSFLRRKGSQGEYKGNWTNRLDQAVIFQSSKDADTYAVHAMNLTPDPVETVKIMDNGDVILDSSGEVFGKVWD